MHVMFLHCSAQPVYHHAARCTVDPVVPAIAIVTPPAMAHRVGPMHATCSAALLNIKWVVNRAMTQTSRAGLWQPQVSKTGSPLDSPGVYWISQATCSACEQGGKNAVRQ